MDATQGTNGQALAKTAPAPPPSPIKRSKWIIEAWAVKSLADKATARSPDGTAASLERQVIDFAAELAGPNPTPMERSLAEVAALNWLAVHYLDTMDFTGSDRTIAQAVYAMRRAESAHKRYLAALKTLATVRKLALPSLQVNIAGTQQVNNGS